ncbi:MAG: hypothetical protein ACYDAG_15010 [Chloroflexota bacterium]
MLRPEGVFYRRSDAGSAVEMDIYEVRDQLLYTQERLRKLTLLRLKIAQFLQQQEMMREEMAGGQNQFDTVIRFDTGSFELLLADVYGLFHEERLPELLRIPLLASMLNGYLNWGREDLRGGVGGFPGPDFKQRESEFHNLCNSSQQYLKEMFGNLGA